MTLLAWDLETVGQCFQGASGACLMARAGARYFGRGHYTGTFAAVGRAGICAPALLLPGSCLKRKRQMGDNAQICLSPAAARGRRVSALPPILFIFRIILSVMSSALKKNGKTLSGMQFVRVEREIVQKRTFTRWINLHLEKCNPPLEVKDLFVDIQDGKILMALLEVLSGRDLLHEYKSSSHRIFRLNNIAKALKFLEDSNVKLVSIDAAEIADGNPSLVLGLIWNIILFFQIKELTGNLSRNSPSSSLSPSLGATDSDSSFPPTPTTERSSAIAVKDQRKAIRLLLAWVQRKTRKYGVAVQDFAGSWRSGLAFLAVIKAIDPSLVDMKQALEEPTRENLEKAFSIARDALHIPRLLEPEDIMVDTPDEQSIVTYVAQFLERFPELEAEDVVDAEKEAPIESTFVRIKESPSEQESQVFLLTKNGERSYTVNHETSHPPPSKVFVPDQPEGADEPEKNLLSDVTCPTPSDSASEFMNQIIDQVFQGISANSSISEPSPESSILSSRKDSRKASSVPVKKTVHFEADTYKDASCSKDPFYSQDLRSEEGTRGPMELPRQDGQVPAVEVAEEKPKEEALSILEAAEDDRPWVDGNMGHSQTSQTSPSWNGALESAASRREAEPPLTPPEENTLLADSLEIKVKLLTVQALGKEDCFEEVPLKASKFNSDLTDFASTSHQQTFSQGPPPPERKPAEEAALEETRAEKLGKRKSKSAHRKQDPDEPQDRPVWDDPHTDPGPEALGSPWAPEEAPAGKKAKVCEKAKHKSPWHRRGEEHGEAGAPQRLEGELPSNPPSSSVSLETLGSPSEERLDFKPSPPLSRLSVIPHDLFYYPHHEVPLSAVLEAYAEGLEDLKSEDTDLEEPEAYLRGLGGAEEAEAAQSGSFLGPGTDHPRDSDQAPCPDRGAEGAQPASEPAPPAPQEALQRREAEESAPAESHQFQEPPNSENLASPLEENVTEKSVSSKKKEKRKHVDHVESSVLLAPGAVRSSDDLEEDNGDHRVLSRTSHSDSSIYIRRHSNRSLESDHLNHIQLRNAAGMDDRGNGMLARYNTQKLTELILQFYGIRADMKREHKHARMKASQAGEAGQRASPSPHSDSLTQFVQQPDMMYFILFLWLLVYCLLLFPQLDVSRL
ncbi:Calmin [Galemys pyrenaicus]|uniref:Calmin n=1 Tax=Galemys pyrenaicus TaxID=202257 RepID=A0A8J6A2P5_GALPY|nr:Calmin [Galemys pyrenaicus]